MKKIISPALVSLLVLANVETGRAQEVAPAPAPEPIPAPVAEPVLVVTPMAEPVPAVEPTPIAEPTTTPSTEATPVAAQAELAGPYRTDVVAQPAQPAEACVRQVRRVPPPPSPRSFRRQWPLTALGAMVGWFAADRAVGPQGSKFAILSSSTLGSIVGSHLQASREGHPNLGRSVMGGLLGAVPAGAVLWMNGADRYNEAELATRGIVPVIGSAAQAVVVSGVTSSSLQPTRIQIIECPHVLPSTTAPPLQ